MRSPILRPTRRELLLCGACASALAILLTWPIAARFTTAGRIDTGDGRFSIWNVAWVAHALTTDPAQLYNANIFYPIQGALTFSEMNLGAGLLAVPGYWISGNPILAHNTAMLAAFVLAGVCTYYLVRHLTGDRRAAAVAGICYAFCPFVFARTTQIQLMMTFGLPLSMLAFHRWADRPSAARAVAMGARA